MNQIIEVLKEINPNVDYKNEKHLISDGLLTSFDIVMLISLLNEKFNVNITVMDLSPENFETVEDIKKLIDSLK